MASKNKRTSIEDIRRIELVQAAHRVFIEHGLGGMTTARICEEAGMSPGILAYYFRGKDEVLLGMVRYNNRILMEDVIGRLQGAHSKWERLVAIVEGNFPERAFERNTANAWLSVVAAAGSNDQYGRLQNIFYKRLASNIGSALSDALSPDRLQEAALGIGVMIDGLWLRKAAGSAISRQAAIQLVIAHVEAFLGAVEVELLKADKVAANSKFHSG